MTLRPTLAASLALAAIGSLAAGARSAPTAGSAASPAAAPAPRASAASAPSAASTRSAARLYVPNQDDATVSVLDPATGRVLATVDLKTQGFSPTAKPHAAIAEPDGSAWYVSLIGDGWVAKFDRANRLVGRAKLETPGMLALDPRHDRVYASRSMTAVNPPASVGVIRRSDMTLVDETDVLLPRPHGIAVDTVTGRLYVSGLGDNRLAVLDTAGHVELADVPGPLHAYVTLALSPDRTRLAASTQLTAKLLGFDVTSGRPSLLGGADVLPFGYQIAWSPDGRSVWLGDQRSGAVTEVDAQGWRVAGTIKDSAFAEPHGVAVSPDGRTVYVSSHGALAGPVTPTAADTLHHGMHRGEGAPRADGTLVLIDARTRAIRQVVHTGKFSTAIGIGGWQ
jgi:YVTN family beta-propeller protein